MFKFYIRGKNGKKKISFFTGVAPLFLNDIRGKRGKHRKLIFFPFYWGGAPFSSTIVFFTVFTGGRSFFFYHIRGNNGKTRCFLPLQGRERIPLSKTTLANQLSTHPNPQILQGLPGLCEKGSPHKL